MSDTNSTYFGTFQLHAHDVWGQLKLAGEKTQLTLRTEQQSVDGHAPSTIYGRLHDFKHVTCIRCVGGQFSTRSWNSEGLNAMSWNIVPHQVLVGNAHFNPNENRVRKATFSTGDIHQIFDDFDSFGTVYSPSPELQNAIPTTIGDRQIPRGDEFKFVYFAGRTKLLSAKFPFGNFDVSISAFSDASSRDAKIEASIWLQLEFEEPATLDHCLVQVRAIGQFLSFVAGRSQGIERLHIEIDGVDKKALPLDVHWTFGARQSDREQDEPSWFDMPLDGVRRPEEFTNVLQNWFASDTHKTARARLYSCLEGGNIFTPDRLVAAANLFDLIKMDLSKDPLPELVQAKQDCLTILKAVPAGEDRDSAIQAIKRIGSHTLIKKVLSRAEILRRGFQLTDLDKVLRQAILLRNYFVHGPGDSRLKFAIVEPHKNFLTQTLEFVFAAAELIECGWDAARWRLRPHTSRHWFIRYVSEYESASCSLLDDLDSNKKTKS